VSSPTAHNQILLGPQTGLREVFSNPNTTADWGVPAKDNLNTGGPVKAGAAISIINNQLIQAQHAAQSSSNLRQHNSVKPSRPSNPQNGLL